MKPRDLTERIVMELRSGRRPLNATEARAVADQIASDVDFYLESKATRGKRRPSAFRIWRPKAIRRLRTLERWLGREVATSSDRPFSVAVIQSVIKKQRELVASLADFRRGLEFIDKTNRREPGRPGDNDRTLMAQSIGWSLERGGVKLTTASDGTFARVLGAVYDEIGLAGISAHKATRAAIDKIKNPASTFYSAGTGSESKQG